MDEDERDGRQWHEFEIERLVAGLVTIPSVSNVFGTRSELASDLEYCLAWADNTYVEVNENVVARLQRLTRSYLIAVSPKGSEYFRATPMRTLQRSASLVLDELNSPARKPASSVLIPMSLLAKKSLRGLSMGIFETEGAHEGLLPIGDGVDRMTDAMNHILNLLGPPPEASGARSDDPLNSPAGVS